MGFGYRFFRRSMAAALVLSLIFASSCGSPNLPTLDLEAENMYKNRLTDMPSSQYGDPFILRHNGYYYLYTTPADTVMQVQRSEDLIHWEMRGEITSDPLMNGAYAPEVKYFNGKFYLVASPSGNGHYILSSDSPEGPFVRETENFKMNIDGSFFVDDDGSWTFFNAASENIEARSMSSPTLVDGRMNLLGTSLLHWTEGPFVIKRNGIYYLTYTGSHFQSKGYRVSYATSTVGPEGPYEISKDNPIVLSTKTGFSNLGHSSSFLGPDLDSWYMVYHDMHMGARGLNIDRLSFNGKRMFLNGPTDFEQPVPSLPRYAVRGTSDLEKSQYKEFNLYLSKEQSQQVFTAEFNFKNGLGSAIIWGYQDNHHFWYAQWNGADAFDIMEVNGGEPVKRDSFILPMAFEPAVLHTLRVASDGSRLEIYFDDMLRYSEELATQAGAVGYLTDDMVEIGYTAISDNAFGSSDNKSVKNLPSAFAAVHHAPTDQNGASSTLFYKTGDTYQSVVFSKGDYASYAVNIGETGLYQLSLECSDEGTGDFEIEVYEDGKRVGSFKSKDLHYAQEGSKGWKTIPLGTVSLQKGLHTLSLRLKSGTLECLTVKADAAAALEETFNIPLTEKSEYLEVITSTNGVRYSEKGMRAAGTDTKVITTSGFYTDFSAKVTVSSLQSASGGETGLVIRMSNASSHDHQLREAFVGYIAAVNGRNITLRHNRYETQRTLGTYRLPEAKEEIQLEIRAQGAVITVYVDGEPVIEAIDPSPIAAGGAGIVFTSEENPVSAVYKDLVVAPLP